MKLLTGDTLALTGGEYTVDLAGQQVSVTGSGTVRFADSANDTYDAALCGSATVNGPRVLTGVTRLSDKSYVTVSGTSYSAHRLDSAITHAVLRPGNAGLYYQARWDCDPVLAAQISGYGIAVSLESIPGADLFTNEATRYTKAASGENTTSVLIENIFSPNAARKKIRAAVKCPCTPLPMYALQTAHCTPAQRLLTTACTALWQRQTA